MFEPEVFRKQIYCIEESTCDIVGTFRLPHSDSVPGELCQPCPLVTPLIVRLLNKKAVSGRDFVSPYGTFKHTPRAQQFHTT